MSSLESVDCTFHFFGEGPQFAAVEEYTCNICIDIYDFDCVADFLLSKIVLSVLKASITVNYTITENGLNHHQPKPLWRIMSISMVSSAIPL